jgi:hypothetical protein
MAKKKNPVIEHLLALLEDDKNAAEGAKRLSPKQRLEAIRMLQAEQGTTSVEARASQVRVPSARAQALQDRNRDPKEEGNLAVAVKFFEGQVDDEPRTDE